MELLVVGHSGAPVLVFPTSRGRFFQWEDFGMFGPLAQALTNGWLQLFCLDGIDNETFYDFDKPPAHALRLHQAYDEHVAREVVPWIKKCNSNPFLIATGTSFGAYQAANFSFRHPELVKRLVAMSGDYCIRQYFPLEGEGNRYYNGLDLYFHNPVDYLPNVTDPRILGHLRQLDIIIAVGSSDFCHAPSQRLSQALHSIQVPHHFNVWGQEWIHDWPTWRIMAGCYL
jgi:esterase/lipase superfamily enzyme